MIQIIALPPAVRRPAGVSVAPDGGVWLVALDGNLLARYDPRTRAVTTFPIPTGAPDAAPSVPPQAQTSRPFGIAHDGDGNVWFSQQYTGQLAVLDQAPPRVTIVSPAGMVRQNNPLLTLLVRERVSAVVATTVRVNGSEAAVLNGRLSLTGLREGRHRLDVEVVDSAGQRGLTSGDFDYAPSSGATRVIQLTPEAPYFSAERLQIARGDTVIWQYTLPQNAHAPAPLKRVHIGGGPAPIQSPLLRAGETYRHRFDAVGTFTVSDAPSGGARTTIVVVDR